MGQSVRQWLLSKPRQPTFVVETHLGAEDHVQTLQWMTARGYGALGEPAAESVKGGDALVSTKSAFSLRAEEDP